MKNPFILILLIFPFSVFAQNWKPISGTERYLYYLDGHGFDSTAVCLQADSADAAGSDSVFYLNRVVRRSAASNGFWRINQPQFLMRKILLRSDGSFSAYDTAGLCFLPYQQLNTSWLYDTVHNITAQIVNETVQTVFAATDSVKTIQLSNGSQIILSKSNGILEFPSSSNPGLYYHLRGITGRNAGQKIPDLNDVFYSINPGDSLEYYTNNRRSGYPSTLNSYYGRHEHLVLLSKSIVNDTVILNFQSDHRDTSSYYNNPAVYSAGLTTVTEKHYRYGSSLLNESFTPAPNNALITTVPTVPGQPSRYDTSSVFACRTVTQYPAFADNTTASGDSLMFGSSYIGWGTCPSPGPGTNEQIFGDGIGAILVQRINGGSACLSSYTRRLLGSRIGGVMHGSFTTFAPIIITGTSTNEKPAFSISPNPAHSLLSVETGSKEQQLLQLYTATGYLIHSELISGQAKIDLSALAPGLYFVKCGNSAVQRFVKD